MKNLGFLLLVASLAAHSGEALATPPVDPTEAAINATPGLCEDLVQKGKSLYEFRRQAISASFNEVREALLAFHKALDKKDAYLIVSLVKDPNARDALAKYLKPKLSLAAGRAAAKVAPSDIHHRLVDLDVDFDEPAPGSAEKAHLVINGSKTVSVAGLKDLPISLQIHVSNPEKETAELDREIALKTAFFVMFDPGLKTPENVQPAFTERQFLLKHQELPESCVTQVLGAPGAEELAAQAGASPALASDRRDAPDQGTGQDSAPAPRATVAGDSKAAGASP